MIDYMYSSAEEQCWDDSPNFIPEETVIYDVAELFKACGDSTRASIMCALMKSEMCVNDIANMLGMTSSAISHQLRILKHMRIVKSRREGKSVFYKLADSHIEEIFKMAFEHVLEEDRVYE